MPVRGARCTRSRGKNTLGVFSGEVSIAGVERCKRVEEFRVLMKAKDIVLVLLGHYNHWL